MVFRTLSGPGRVVPFTDSDSVSIRQTRLHSHDCFCSVRMFGGSMPHTTIGRWSHEHVNEGHTQEDPLEQYLDEMNLDENPDRATTVWNDTTMSC